MIQAYNTFDLVIVGAGLYGICAANTYLSLHPGAEILVLDGDDDVGGVWATKRLYPQFWSQNGIRISGYPDKPLKLPDEAEVYHDLFEAKYLSRYLEDYVTEHVYNGRSLRDRITFNCWVRRMEKSSDGIWAITAELHGEEATYKARKVIVATGSYTEPNMPALPGRESFKGALHHQKAFGESRVLTSEEPDIEKHEHITILGGSKSAADIAYAAATDTHRARKVSWIIRTSGLGPLHFAGVKSSFTKYRNLTELASTRVVGALSPANLYLPENSWREWFMHRTWLGELILSNLWGGAEREYHKQADFEGRKGALPGFEGLRSEANVMWLTGYLGLMQRDDYWDMIAQRVHIYRSDVARLTEDAVVLADGREVTSDVLLCATGWREGHPFFSPGEAARLGLPMGLDSPELGEDEEAKWRRLHGTADKHVLQRWPQLVQSTKFEVQSSNTTPYRLYSMIVPVDDQSIAFLGVPLVPNAYHTSVPQCLFAIAALDGVLRLPPKEDMERDVALTNAWNRRRYPVMGLNGNNLDFEMLAYTDRLLDEVGLSSHKPKETRTWSGWWSLLTDVSLASDYAGLVDEYKGKYMAQKGEK